MPRARKLIERESQADRSHGASQVPATNRTSLLKKTLFRVGPGLDIQQTQWLVLRSSGSIKPRTFYCFCLKRGLFNWSFIFFSSLIKIDRRRFFSERFRFPVNRPTPSSSSSSSSSSASAPISSVNFLFEQIWTKSKIFFFKKKRSSAKMGFWSFS